MIAQDVLIEDEQQGRIPEVAVEDNRGEEMDNIQPYTITSFGTDFDVDGLVKRMKRGQIAVPEFQRSYVWSDEKASRFIESLLLGLPVPLIFLVRERENSGGGEDGSQRLMVIDGNQRLTSLRRFYDDEFALKGVQKEYEGKLYSQLPAKYQLRLDDSVIRATIIEQDRLDDDNSIYYIFQRLNTGGMILYPHEVRSVYYHGGLDDLIKKLNENENWRNLYGTVSARKRDQELILRFLAFYHIGEDYREPLGEFLNTYMKRNRNPSDEQREYLQQLFERTVATVFNCIGTRAFKRNTAVNAALAEAVMVGVAYSLRLNGEPISRLLPNKPECKALGENFDQLIANPDFIDAISNSTGNQSKVATRLRLAKELLGKAA